MGGEKPLAQAVGNWALLMQVTGSWIPLGWAKGSRGLSVMWCLLHDLQAAGMDSGGISEAEGGIACHNWGPVTGLHLQPQSPQGLAKKKKEGSATKHHTWLFSLPWEHTYHAAATSKCPR